LANPPRPPKTNTPLIAEYSSRFRLVEISAIGIFAALSTAIAARGYSTQFSVSAGQIAVTVFFGALLADLVSGLVHWAADTWGNQTWPIVGPTLIRSFREHHVDAEAITRHDFVEANGATALVLLPVMVTVQLSLPSNPSAWTPFQYQASLLTLSVSSFVFMTNQIHKWSHVDRPPHFVRLLQRLGLILTAEHHRVHHTGRHTSRYCITTGWLNPLLDHIQFFRMSEKLIQTISTLQPREDDLKLMGMSAGTAAVDTASQVE
jgi:ubiquitin-conjugating enzyme E2 variant